MPFHIPLNIEPLDARGATASNIYNLAKIIYRLLMKNHYKDGVGLGDRHPFNIDKRLCSPSLHPSSKNLVNATDYKEFA